MKNSRGSVLVATIGFVLVFTLFGFSSIFLSNVQSDATNRQVASTQAFWLAEAGINRAITLYPFTGLNLPYSDNSLANDFANPNWSYSFKIEAVGGEAYHIKSLGAEGSIKRKIEVDAIKTHYIIENVITAAGYVDTVVVGDTEIIGKIEECVDFYDPDLFGDVFNRTKEEISAVANHVPPNNNPDQDPTDGFLGISGVTWITNPGTPLMITDTGSWQGSGILIVDGDLKITGGSFDGIIWVTGNLRVDGNPPINGTIFVEGDEDIVITRGTSNIKYCLEAIEAALGLLEGYGTSIYKLTVQSWKETYDYDQL